jgi:Uma2 family endonuclease
MATVGTQLMTAEQFYDFTHRPENEGKFFELERGEVVEMSRPGKRHGLICANVARILGNFAVQRKKGYVCSNDTGVVVQRNPDTVRGPDVLFFEDVTSIDDVEEKYGEGPPLLAVEVLSPNDTHTTVYHRVREQLRFGTRLVWVLDPDARNVLVHQTGNKPEVVEEKLVPEREELTGEDVLPDFRCRVADFFALPGTTAEST